MATTFAAEGTQDHQLECIDVEIIEKELMIDSFEYDLSLDLKGTGREVKGQFLDRSIKVPIDKKINRDIWSLVYIDDMRREVIPDNNNLLGYEKLLAGENSKLQVVTPKPVGPLTPPPIILGHYSVTPKPS